MSTHPGPTRSMRSNHAVGIEVSCRSRGCPSRPHKRRPFGGARASERLKITASAWVLSWPLRAVSGTRAGAKIRLTLAFDE
eukprot:696939-Pyramimonas_sp.AAC.1